MKDISKQSQFDPRIFAEALCARGVDFVALGSNGNTCAVTTCSIFIKIIQTESLKIRTPLGQIASFQEALLGSSVKLKTQIARILSRHTGLGVDNLLLLDDLGIIPQSPSCSSLNLIGFNSDGSRVGMCVNGSRCFGWLVRWLNLAPLASRGIEFSLDGNKVLVEYADSDSVSVALLNYAVGVECFKVDGFGVSADQELSVSRLADSGMPELTLNPVWLGNPHVVLFAHEIDEALFVSFAEGISNDPLFKHRMNLEWVEVLDSSKLRVLFFERGVGWTTSSGSGSGAAALASYTLGLCGPEIVIQAQGGRLSVQIDEKSKSLKISASVSPLFLGKFVSLNH